MGSRFRFHSLWKFRKKLKDYTKFYKYGMSPSENRERENEVITELVNIWLSEGDNWME